MPPEPFPWDRKDFFKERKHERSSESLGPVSRWREFPHHGSSSRDFGRWGSAEFRSRPPGHGKQGGWHLFGEESTHGLTPSRSAEKVLDEEGCRPSGFRVDGKHGRNSRENRSFSEKDWKGHTWEKGAAPHDNGDQRPIYDNLNYNSHHHCDFVKASDQVHFKDQNDKIGGAHGTGMGSGTGQRYERENSLGSMDWKPLKWTRSGSMSSRGSGFSHSSSSKSMGVDSNEAKAAEVQPRNLTPVRSPSGDALACVTSASPSEEMNSRKKPRLGWGEGLAKYEKKKVEDPEDNAMIKTGAGVTICSSTEPFNSYVSSMADKSPRRARFSDCTSPATPSPVACSSSPGEEGRGSLVKESSIIYNDTSKLSHSPNIVSQNHHHHHHLEALTFNLEDLKHNLIANVSSKLNELLQFDETSSGDSVFVRSTALNKLLVWKGEALKALETTESEIDLLENELKSIISESAETSCPPPCPASSSSLPDQDQAVACNLVPRPAQLQLDVIVENKNDDSVEEAVKDDDIDSPGTVTSKFVELISTTPKDGYMNLEVQIPEYSTTDATSSDCEDGEDGKYELILASNRENAERASEVFNNLLPATDGNGRISGSKREEDGRLIRERFAKRQRFLRFKERVITLKYRAFQHLWKEDMRMLSIRKYRAKSQKKFEISSRTAAHSGYQKNRSSIRSRFSSPGNLSLVPTTEIINFTGKLLSDSQVKTYRNTLKMPALSMDKIASRFVSTNGLVEDPCAIEKEKEMINPWLPHEKEIFMEKLSAFGKDFRKIASFLDHKSTADCIDFYYKNHKSDSFEKTKKSEVDKQAKPYSTSSYLVTSGKRWTHEMNNAVSIDTLPEASRNAVNADVAMETEHKTEGDDDAIGSSERETAAADVLAGICGSLSSEAMSSCITSSFDPGEGYQKVSSLTRCPLTPEVNQNVDEETCSDESCGEMDPSDWTDEEKSVFIGAVSSYGRDFAMISRCVRTRSRDQCKVFFSKARKCLGLDLIQCGPGNDGRPASDNGNGGAGSESDNNACIVSDSVTKMEVDPPPLTDDVKSDHDPVGTIKVQIDVNIIEEKNGTVEQQEYNNDDDGELGSSENMVTDNMVTDNNLEREDRKDEGDCNNNIDNVPVVEEAPSTAMNEADLSSGTGEETISNEGGDNHHCGSVSGGIENDIKEVVEVSAAKDEGGQVEKTPENENENDIYVTNVGGGSGDVVNCSTELECNGNAELKPSSGSGMIPPLIKPCEKFSLLKEDDSPAPVPVPVPVPYSLNLDHLQNGRDHHLLRYQKSSSVESYDPHWRRHPLMMDGVAPSSSSSQTLIRGGGGGYHPSTEKVVNGGDHHHQPSSRNYQSGKNLSQGFHLHKCSNTSSKAVTHGDQHLFMPQDKTKDPSSSQQTRSLSDAAAAEKPRRNGDVKLFGQILTHRSSSSTNEDKVAVPPHSNLSGKSFNLKFGSSDENSTIISSLEQQRNNNNNYMGGLENSSSAMKRSYGFWDGNRIQTGFPSLPDSAVLLAKYPAAFVNYATEHQQQPLHHHPVVVKNNERSLNGVSVFPNSSSNGVAVPAEYIYRSRDGGMGPKVGQQQQQFAIDLKKRQEMLITEMLTQRRASTSNGGGFEAVVANSILQQQQQGGMNNMMGRRLVGGGGGGGAVSDPVAAIKMHYANTTKGGSSIGREEETWRGKNGDIGR